MDGPTKGAARHPSGPLTGKTRHKPLQERGRCQPPSPDGPVLG